MDPEVLRGCLIYWFWCTVCDTSLPVFEHLLRKLFTINLIQVHWELTIFLCLTLMVSDTRPPTVSYISQQMEIQFKSY